VNRRSVIAALGLALLIAPAFRADAQPASAGSAASGPGEQAVAIFAGGCFWCMEPAFDKVDGVLSTTSGYTGGSKAAPTYEEVSAGGTGHAEAVKVVYDPKKVGYAKLLEVFWRNVDPLTPNAQFCDHGSQYRSAIFYGSEHEKSLAEGSKEALAKSGRFKSPIVTEIAQAGAFYPAEDYHQDYYLKNPLKYKFYRSSCGRDRRLKELWGDEAGGHSS
jgi:peptide-methionine (S)-S-oxide reductase